MRKWLPYEINQLIKYGFPIDNLHIYEDKPVEYVTGKADFCGLIFDVNEKVLIPRVETDKLVDLALNSGSGIKPALPRGRSGMTTIADVATGSGCIGITLANKMEFLNMKYELVLTDISRPALDIAKVNAERLLKNLTHVIFVESDLLDNLKPACRQAGVIPKFDLIVSNLPYIPTARISSLDTSVREFEPLGALDGGKDGLKYIKKLLAQSKSYLKPNGEVILEIDETHNLNDLEEFGNYEFRIYEDQFGKNRFLTARLD